MWPLASIFWSLCDGKSNAAHHLEHLISGGKEKTAAKIQSNPGKSMLEPAKDLAGSESHLPERQQL